MDYSMRGGFIDAAVEQILDIMETLCTALLNPYNPYAREYELERQLQRTAAQLLPNHLRGFSPYITMSSLETYISSPSPAVNMLFSDANPESRPIQMSEGDAFAIKLAAYKLVIIYDGPEVVLIHAANSANGLLATLAGRVLIEEKGKEQTPQTDRMNYVAFLGLAAETSGRSGTFDPRLCSEYHIAGAGLR